MIPRFLRLTAALAFGASLLTLTAAAQQLPNEPQSPYGGTTVEAIIARVNDQIITSSDYNRALADLEQEDRQRGDTMQQMADDRHNLLRSLIDQQLWLSKGKQLGITGDTELIKRLDDIRQQYHLASMEDLEKAAQQQGVSFEDFKQNIRNQIVTQDVMRQEVGAHIQITPGEARQYYEQHLQDYMQPESEHLSEILISTGKSDADGADDPAKVAAAKAKAEDIEARLNAGGDFAQLARSFSDGPTAGSGGDLGQFRRGALAKVLEDQTFDLKAGQWTQPIRTRQGWIILKVTQHTPGGVQPFDQVQQQVEEALYMSQMEPAIRAYLTRMRTEAFIDIAPGYEDTGASPNETKPIFSAYVPPAPKKKAKVERTRYRESGRGFRQKSGPMEPAVDRKKESKAKDKASERPGRKEKIRYGQAPRATLPTAENAATNTVDAGALPETAADEPVVNPLEPRATTRKTRFSDVARTERKHKDKEKTKKKKPAVNSFAPAPPDAAEVANRQLQSAPLGLNGDTSAKKKKKAPTTAGPKTRLSQEKKKPEDKQPLQMTPAPQEPGAPAPDSGSQAPQQ